MNIHKLAKELGRKGGLARAQKLSAKRRKEIASLGGVSKSLSQKANERIESNFRFWETMKILRPSQKVKSVSRVNYRLPEIYACPK
ncbi:MAG: hypothetical protein HQM15_01860 [Deltaproteobacteria bacterium]|nr:hypothetical protein [Deltaproteobacteria bacterium]